MWQMVLWRSFGSIVIIITITTTITIITITSISTVTSIATISLIITIIIVIHITIIIWPAWSMLGLRLTCVLRPVIRTTRKRAL